MKFGEQKIVFFSVHCFSFNFISACNLRNNKKKYFLHWFRWVIFILSCHLQSVNDTIKYRQNQWNERRTERDREVMIGVDTRNVHWEGHEATDETQIYIWIPILCFLFFFSLWFQVNKWTKTWNENTQWLVCVTVDVN